MPCPQYRYENDELMCEKVPLSALAEKFGTPLYVYSKSAVLDAFNVYQTILQDTPHLVCYALKANANLAIIELLAQAGAGFDIVSGGELARVLAAGGDPHKVIYSGVGKTAKEIAFALENEIHCFNVESIPELDRIQEVAASLNKIAPISVRVNPNVDAKTHPYISTGLKNNKFGVAYEDCVALYQRAQSLPNIKITGIDCHIGSQITQASPYLDAADKILDLVEKLHNQGIHLEHIDFGGGIGVRYEDTDTPIDMKHLILSLKEKLHARGFGHLTMVFEPGRSIVANAGCLLMQTQYIKKTDVKNFLITDASMAEMARPALYEAWMPVYETTKHSDREMQTFEVVGPVCESSDWLAKDRQLAVEVGDYLAMMVAGAYGMSMASNYNARPRPAELMIDGEMVHVIRERETIESLWRNEHLLMKH
ncbi:MAG: diaminopimelate decarboxylase [Burkholderiaceae bacterium]|nr:diaminopimelate decarboxylase [Burkholderiaceae bacterium]